MAQQTIKMCTGCGRLNTQPLGLNENGEPYLACCPDNNYKPITAVEWLEMTFNMREGFLNTNDFKQAKQMEKEQIMKAVDRGFDEGCKFPEDMTIRNSEQYYNETYGSNNKI